MRLLAPAAIVTSALLASAFASAQSTPAAPPAVAAPVVAAPVVAAPVAPVFAAPQAPAFAPVYPAPPLYQPGYAAPYMVYMPPGAGAPPPYWTPMVQATERNSNAMRNTGIVLFTAGALVTAVGGVIFGAVATTGCALVDAPGEIAQPGPAPAAERVRSSHQALNGCDTSPVVGAGIIAAGMLTAALGVPLFVIGSRQVPARMQTGNLAPELRVGAANASLRWSF